MYKIYQVVNGDTIESIARAFNTTTDMIKNLNGTGSIVAGNYIVVPNDESRWFSVYVVQRGDNVYQIAEKYNTSVKNVLALNGLDKDDYIYPNQEILVPNPGVNVFVTEDGNTLGDAADMLGSPVTEIINQNDKIYLLPEQLLIYKKKEIV